MKKRNFLFCVFQTLYFLPRWRVIWFYLKGLVFRHGEKWDALSPLKDDAIRFANKYINPRLERMPSTDNERYITEYSEEAQSSFRNGKPTERAQELSRSIVKYRTSRDIVAYRGVSSCPLAYMVKNSKRARQGELREAAFLYCSLVKGFEHQDDFKMRVFLPKGANAFYGANLNNEENLNYDLVVQCGALLQIVSIDKQYINCRLKME